jgi:glycosyltransferase involved in cell wall biosynthesis
MISIIIPTLNEEKYLPRLLDNIESHNILDYEIIVSDGNSKDNTLKIANKYGCKTVVSKKRKPAIQRNNGAKIAKGEILFFIDADTLLPDNFFKDTLREFHRKQLDVAGFYFILNSKKLLYKLATQWGHMNMFLLSFLTPLSMGAAIISKKEYHDLAGGFNEKIFMGEDHLYSIGLTKVGAKHRLITSTKILFDIRRFEKEGPFRVIYKWYYMLFYYIFRGPFSKEIIEYEFGNY